MMALEACRVQFVNVVAERDEAAQQQMALYSPASLVFPSPALLSLVSPPADRQG
jgi:hypothetical protein